MAQVQLLRTSEGEEFRKQLLSSGEEAVHLLAETSPASGGIEALLFAEVLGMWTAFETMAQDSWEGALNTHPVGLAELKGVRNRIRNKWKSAGLSSSPPNLSDKDEVESKLVPLNAIQRYQFDLRTRMGTILRDRLTFSGWMEYEELTALLSLKTQMQWTMRSRMTP